ncbi:MAG: hypothetical protein L3J35_12565 [Bacteroidales bacterium]|nr:hypothetical protein [Bacteroidales bacterium]
MKKFLIIAVAVIIFGFSAFYAFVYYVPLSEGSRSGKLVKISKKGVLFKTYEGIVSQGVSGEQTFYFSVLDNQKEAIEKLKSLQGQYVKITYVERFKTFAWWGDTRHFVSDVEKIETEKQETDIDLYNEISKLKLRVKKLENTINSLLED